VLEDDVVVGQAQVEAGLATMIQNPMIKRAGQTDRTRPTTSPNTTGGERVTSVYP
jgi:hypothetical protein